MIYIIGDSHSAIFSITSDIKYMTPEYQLITNSQFNSYRTKPFTAYNLKTKIGHIEEIIKNIKYTKE